MTSEKPTFQFVTIHEDDPSMITVKHKEFEGSLKIHKPTLGILATQNRVIASYLGGNSDPSLDGPAYVLGTLQVAMDNPPESYKPDEWVSPKLSKEVDQAVSLYWETFQDD